MYGCSDPNRCPERVLAKATTFPFPDATLDPKQNRHATTPFCASWQSTHPAKNGPFLSLPYVCPEPVLVKCSVLCMNGSKRGVFTHLHILVLIDFVLLTRSVETAGKNNGARVCVCVCVSLLSLQVNIHQ
jgi:hypothetical protein